MPRRIVEDSDEEDSDGEGAPVTKPVAGRRKLSASALGKRPAVPAKPAKGRPKSKQLSDKELGVRGAKEVMELSDDDDFEPDDSEDSEEDESDSEEESSSEEDDDDSDGDESDGEEQERPRRSAKRQKAPKAGVEAPAASARRVATVRSYKEPGLNDTDILDDDEHSDEVEALGLGLGSGLGLGCSSRHPRRRRTQRGGGGRLHLGLGLA